MLYLAAIFALGLIFGTWYRIVNFLMLVRQEFTRWRAVPPGLRHINELGRLS